MLRGRIFYRGEFVEAGIEVDEEGRIERIGKLVEGKEVRGIILPAGIDVHVHFRDFREKHKETIESGSLSALHGGICLVVDQPNTNPVIDSEDVYRRRMEIAEKRTFVDYTCNIALTRENLEDVFGFIEQLERIKRDFILPAVGEVFIQHSSRNLEIDYEGLEKFLTLAQELVTVHAEDPKFVERGNPNFMFRKREAEIVAVERCVRIAEKLKAEIHFCHLSTPEAVEKCRYGTFEVTPHHLLLSVDDYGRLNGVVNVNPPLRRREDAEWMLKNFHRIDILASDHAPHTVEEKMDGASGFPGVEVMYPIFLNLALKGVVGFSELVEKIAINPARIFGFKGYGGIETGNFANFVVFDKEREKIRADKLHSLCNWTPYEGFDAVFPKEVYIRGEEVLGSETRAGRVLRWDAGD